MRSRPNSVKIAVSTFAGKIIPLLTLGLVSENAGPMEVSSVDTVVGDGIDYV